MPKQKWGSKLYCAEPEGDPFESWYRKSDVFLDYMNEAPCKVPKVEDQVADPVEALETIDSIDLPAHRLTGKVRCQYLGFLEKLLESNYESWAGTVESYENVTFSMDEVKRCAESIEMKAVQSCMIVSLYRNYILKVISQIRKETKESNLHPNLINMKFTPKKLKKESCNVSVQTELAELNKSPEPQTPPSLVLSELPLLDIPVMSLDEKIRNFEKKLHVISPKIHTNTRGKTEHQKKNNLKEWRKSSSRDRPVSHRPKVSTRVMVPQVETHNKTPESSQCLPLQVAEIPAISIPSNDVNMVVPKPPIASAEDDQIMRELEAMFETGDDGNIFDSCENQVQINAIINEIEKFDPPNVSELPKTVDTQPPQEIMHPPSPSFNYPINSNDPTSLNISKDFKQNADGKKADLKKSIWPCEFHMQKMKLRDLLSYIADNNYLKYERIRARFIILFGEYEQEEDELGPYSPSIELNDVLIVSCRQRIAKWVVQALMKPLKDGLIGNRFLFKRLAKHLADSITYLNQYPDQRYIKNYVVDFFCTHPAVLSLEDMS